MNKALISPEVLVPRLGEQLVKAGLLTDVQLANVLEFQRKRLAENQPLLLGQAIVEMGYLDRPALDRAVTEQILRFRAALEDANRNLETRVQQRTAELEDALRKLSELNQLKANIISNISHELRTPLTHIRGYLELLQTDSLGELNEDQKKAIDVAMRSAGRLQSLIDDLILFSQASRGEMTLSLQSVDLREAIAGVVARSSPRADAQKIELSVDIPDPMPMVRADAEKMGWVLTQLLDNAIKFTPSGGKISLELAVENNNLLRITVKDNGIGIPHERIQEVFEPFHQLDGSPTRRYGGTGLGLALVREIVEAHGSMIDIRSQSNQGTQVSFPLLIAKMDE